MDQHVRPDLSAYLDEALPAEQAATVRGHLDGCAACRGDLAQLRATARLLAQLPAPVASRRLVPALAPRFNWLRPLRSLSAVGAGMFLLLFMASATLDSGWRMGGGAIGTTAARPAAPESATFGAGAPAAAATATPEAAPQPAADAARTALSAASPSPDVKSAEQTAEAARQGAAPSPAPMADTALQNRAVEPPQIGPSPWLWLTLTVVSALAALVAHRRLSAR